MMLIICYIKIISKRQKRQRGEGKTKEKKNKEKMTEILHGILNCYLIEKKRVSA